MKHVFLVVSLLILINSCLFVNSEQYQQQPQSYQQQFQQRPQQYQQQAQPYFNQFQQQQPQSYHQFKPLEQNNNILNSISPTNNQNNFDPNQPPVVGTQSEQNRKKKEFSTGNWIYPNWHSVDNNWQSNQWPINSASNRDPQNRPNSGYFNGYAGGFGGCASSPCHNGAGCKSIGMFSYECDCAFSFYGVRCEHRNGTQVLVVILATVLPVLALIIIVACIIFFFCFRKRDTGKLNRRGV